MTKGGSRPVSVPELKVLRKVKPRHSRLAIRRWRRPGRIGVWYPYLKGRSRIETKLKDGKKVYIQRLMRS